MINLTVKVSFYRTYNPFIFLGIALLTVQLCYSQSSNQIVNAAGTHFAGAEWISDNKSIPSTDSLFYQNDPSPVFRKEIIVNADIESARLFITAAGYYKATINGARIDSIYLDPAWTNFGKRVYYTEYDVSGALKKGNNCIGIVLGNGFYNPLPLKMWGHLNLRRHLTTGRPAFIAKIIIKYKNGKTDEIVTDSSWKYSYGPIIKNNVYIGEIYDSRKEIKGWDKAAFDDKKWNASVIKSGPGGALKKTFFPPVKITSMIRAKSINSSAPRVYVADMGKNFTGIYRVRLQGRPGDTVKFRFGERLYKDGSLNPMTTVAGQIKKPGIGGPGAPSVAWQTDSYIIGTNKEVWYTPEFTFHTFRYMEIEGLKYKPKSADIYGLALNTDVKQNNSFSCSSKLINQIQEMTTQTFRSNLISVQSDCAAREKFGYGGDLNAVGESFIYNFDMRSFYRKTVYDWVDAMNDSAFVDTAPYVGLKYCGISWESAFLLTQYNLLLYYNDIDFIKELYQTDLKWMDKVARIHPNGIVDAGLGDHEAIAKSPPVQLIGTSHYLQAARIMKKFAGLMNDPENERRFEMLEKDLSNKIRQLFWVARTDTIKNKQTLFASLLYYKLIPEQDLRAAKDSLRIAADTAIAGHFITGIFGTKYILEAMSENGMAAEVYNIVNSTEFPGWGYMVDKGATTIWETWKESDNIYSNCHPMFGTVSEWFYRWLGGIRPHPDFPGFRKFTIAPFLPDNLDYANCSYQSPFGLIKSSWKKNKDNTHFEVSVPDGSSAIIKIPTGKQKLITIKDSRTDKIIYKTTVQAKEFEYELQNGSYLITTLN